MIRVRRIGMPISRGRLRVVADDVGVLAEAVPVEQHPRADRGQHEPVELHRDAEAACRPAGRTRASPCVLDEGVALARRRARAARPRKRNCVPIVTTSDGMPTNVTTRPLKRPGQDADGQRADDRPARRCRSPAQTQTKPTMPSAMIDGNERSMSPAMMTIVRGMAMIAKYGRRLGERQVDRGRQERPGRQDDEGEPEQQERDGDADLRRPGGGERR